MPLLDRFSRAGPGRGSRRPSASPRRAQAQGWPAIAAGRAHPDPGPHRLGQDAGRLPVGHRPADDRAGARRRAAAHPARSTSRRCGPSPSTSRRTCGRRSPASASPPSASATTVHEPTVGIRTGDTSADERRRLVRHPPDLLITTPESLYLMLTSPGAGDARAASRPSSSTRSTPWPPPSGAPTSSLTLERLEHLVADGRQRRPAAHRPVGHAAPARGDRPLPRRLRRRPRRRPVTIVDAGVRKPLDVEVVVPVEDMGELGEVVEEPRQRPGRRRPGARGRSGRRCTPACSSSIEEHRSTLIFVNARRLAERLATRLNELAAEGETRPRRRADRHAAPARASSW